MNERHIESMFEELEDIAREESYVRDRVSQLKETVIDALYRRPQIDERHKDIINRRLDTLESCISRALTVLSFYETGDDEDPIDMAIAELRSAVQEGNV